MKSLAQIESWWNSPSDSLPAARVIGGWKQVYILQIPIQRKKAKERKKKERKKKEKKESSHIKSQQIHAQPTMFQ